MTGGNERVGVVPTVVVVGGGVMGSMASAGPSYIPQVCLNHGPRIYDTATAIAELGATKQPAPRLAVPDVEGKR